MGYRFRRPVFRPLEWIPRTKSLVSDCNPDEVVAPADAKWEPCLVLRTNKRSYDVQILTDNGLVEAKNVPKRFVRQLKIAKAVSTPVQRKRKRSYGWSAREIELLEEAKSARVQALLAGAPASQPNAFIRKFLKERNVEKR